MCKCKCLTLWLAACSLLGTGALAGDQGHVIGEDADNELATSIEWDEIESDDQCERRAAARFQYVASAGHSSLAQAELWREELAVLNETASKYCHNRTVSKPDVVRKLQIVCYPGEALLPEDKRDMIVNFTVEVEQILRTSIVRFKENGSLDISGVEAGMAEYRDVNKLLFLWQQWYQLFLPLQQDYLPVLELTNNIATENENPDAESYWLMLAEYPGSYEDARQLWQQIEPLYLKIHSYVRSQLLHRYGHEALVGNSTIPAYLLGSLGALDWSNIADIVLGEDDDVYSTLQKNFKVNEVGGKKSYELADKLVQSMGFEGLHKEFWEDSRFDMACHSEVVEFCSTGRTRVITCNRTTWQSFMEAHEIVMKAIRRQVISKQPYTFMNPNRQSAAQEAAVELLALLAASPAHLQRLGLLPAELVNSSAASVSLKMLVALRTLPRLAYYLSVDLWRLELLNMDNVTIRDAAESWTSYKQNFSHIEIPGNSTWWDFMPDEFMTSNKPYLAKFVGTILQFQMLELFENNTLNGSTVLKVIQGGDQLKQLLQDGLSAAWPELLKKDLGVERVDTGALRRYFSSLEDFLDRKENATRSGNRGMAIDAVSSTPGALDDGWNATSGSLPDADRRASSIGSGILIGCVTVATIGIVVTIFLVARRRFKRSRSDYHLAKTSPE